MDFRRVDINLDGGFEPILVENSGISLRFHHVELVVTGGLIRIVGIAAIDHKYCKGLGCTLNGRYGSMIRI